jgi:hypothetical protein
MGKLGIGIQDFAPANTAGTAGSIISVMVRNVNDFTARLLGDFPAFFTAILPFLAK